jgi:hypothetical protein
MADAVIDQIRREIFSASLETTKKNVGIIVSVADGIVFSREEDFVGVFLLWENILHRQKKCPPPENYPCNLNGNP